MLFSKVGSEKERTGYVHKYVGDVCRQISRGSIHLSPYREISCFRLGRKIHFISWNTKLVTVLPYCRLSLLPCCRVTNSLQTVPVLRQTNLFGSIQCTVRSFIVILFFHLRLFQRSELFPFLSPRTLLMHFLTLSEASHSRPNHRM